MWASPPWKLAVAGAVGVIAGVVLLSLEWTVAALAAFAGFALVTRGALHLVTSAPFVGLAGAFAVLEVAGDVAVGSAVLAWPEPTVGVVSIVLGTWAILHSVVGGTIAITTRSEHRSWPLFIAFAVLAAALGAILVADPNGSVDDAALVIGLLALLEGARELCHAAIRHHADRRSGGEAVSDASTAA